VKGMVGLRSGWGVAGMNRRMARTYGRMREVGGGEMSGAEEERGSKMGG